MSDHLSGPRALAEPTADITDLYAFPTPGQAGALTLVMNVLPHAKATSRFSSAVLYRFRLRPADIADTGLAARFAVSTDELVVTCVFDEPTDAHGQNGQKQAGRCVASSGKVTHVAVAEESGGQGDGMRVLAGPRRDPFFIDAKAARAVVQERALTFIDPAPNTLDGHNVLSIVVELAPVMLQGIGPVMAVVAETLTAGKLETRIERVGRPEIKNLVLAPRQFDPVNRDLEIRDLYNMEDAFSLATIYLGAYRARFNANLAFYDSLDAKIDWLMTADRAHPLTEMLLADFLVVDCSKPFSEDSYFEIERAMLAARPHATCGGRALNDDIIDTLYTTLINAGKGPRIRDGVDQASVRAGDTFPYLAPPAPDD